MIYFYTFTLIGLGSLIFIDIKTNLSNSKATYYIIKQTTYGILIALLVYNFFFSIFFYAIQKDFFKDETKFLSDCGISFSILIGVVNIVLTFILKNIITGITNIIIYIGMIIYFFKISKEERKNYNGLTEGLIDCGILLINLVVLVFLFIKYKKSNYNLEDKFDW